MKLGKVLLSGFLIWVILFFVGWLFLTILPELLTYIMLILGIILIYLFSKQFLKEKQIILVGTAWFLINFVLDLIFLVLLLGNSTYYAMWSIWVFYVLLIFGPLLTKSLK
ncbi:MAG: hypothetical protein KJ674_04200 [Nanoarchaeota archaeon]|nr:hypothetical protein [Nanoarchaeota archaeon]